MLKDEIREIARQIYGSAVEHRRHLHKFPELSFQEHQTAAFIRSCLDRLNIPWTPLAQTGVMGTITGEKSSDKVIALRADMDALPIAEKNEVEYASVTNGVMHACGHDAHMASLLGTASILQTLKSRFGGTVKLLFQPGEENMPGGASIMIKEGALENPKPNAVIGQHVSPSIDVGKIGIRTGKFMASMDELYVTVHGKGGHGAQPHQNVDPVLIASHIIVALQQVVSRMASPGSPTVLSFGKVVANGATNVIPDKVYMEGTFRAMDEEWRSVAHGKMTRLATGIAESMGAHCDFKIVRGYPFLMNEEELTKNVRRYAEEYLGPDNVVDVDIWMAAEDFAYYSQVADACFYLLGTNPAGLAVPRSLHTSTFGIDEGCLETATGLMAYIALRNLDM